jgi:Putative zinc-finger
MPLHLSGELDSASMSQFERHVDECPACQKEIEEHQELNKGIRVALLSESVDSTGMRRRVLAEIEGERTVSIFTAARQPGQQSFANRPRADRSLLLFHREDVEHKVCSLFREKATGVPEGSERSPVDLGEGGLPRQVGGSW